MKSFFVGLDVLTVFPSLVFCQPVVVLDGFFLAHDSSMVINEIGIENIIKFSQLSSDSAMSLIGEHGKNGLLIFESNDKKTTWQSYLSVDSNLLFHDTPAFIVDDVLMINFNPETLDPNKIESIEIIGPLKSIIDYGRDYTGGIIKIKMKE